MRHGLANSLVGCKPAQHTRSTRARVDAGVYTRLHGFCWGAAGGAVQLRYGCHRGRDRFVLCGAVWCCVVLFRRHRYCACRRLAAFGVSKSRMCACPASQALPKGIALGCAVLWKNPGVRRRIHGRRKNSMHHHIGSARLQYCCGWREWWGVCVARQMVYCASCTCPSIVAMHAACIQNIHGWKDVCPKKASLAAALSQNAWRGPLTDKLLPASSAPHAQCAPRASTARTAWASVAQTLAGGGHRAAGSGAGTLRHLLGRGKKAAWLL